MMKRLLPLMPLMFWSCSILTPESVSILRVDLGKLAAIEKCKKTLEKLGYTVTAEDNVVSTNWRPSREEYEIIEYRIQMEIESSDENNSVIKVYCKKRDEGRKRSVRDFPEKLGEITEIITYMWKTEKFHFTK